MEYELGEVPGHSMQGLPSRVAEAEADMNQNVLEHSVMGAP